MYYIYTDARTLDEIIARGTTNPTAIKVAAEMPRLRSSLCLNANLDEKTWFNLARKKATADELYFLAVNSFTLDQAEFIFNDKRYVPKVGLLRSNNPSVTKDFLQKIYHNFQCSTIIQEALLARTDLPLSIFDDLSKNPKLLYQLMNHMLTNENVTLNWIINYYEQTAGQLERKIFLRSLPGFLDSYPELIEYFFKKTTSYDILTTATDKLNILSAIAESRFLTTKQADTIFDVVKNSKSKSALKAKILLSLLGNPNISQVLVGKLVTFFNTPATLNVATQYQVINFTALVDKREDLPKVSLKPGWDYEFSPDETQLLSALKTMTQNYPARVSILQSTTGTVFFPANNDNTAASLPEKEILESLANPSDNNSYWSWREHSIDKVYLIDKILESEPKATWVNFFNLAGKWGSSISDLLNASKSL